MTWWFEGSADRALGRAPGQRRAVRSPGPSRSLGSPGSPPLPRQVPQATLGSWRRSSFRRLGSENLREEIRHRGRVVEDALQGLYLGFKLAKTAGRGRLRRRGEWLRV